MSSVIKVDGLIAVNFFDLSPLFNTAIHNHDEWEFVYVDSGEIKFIVDGESKLLKQGDIIFHSPQVNHGTVCNEKTSASIFNMHFICNSPAIQSIGGQCITASSQATDALKALINECNLTYRVSHHPVLLRDNAPLGGEQMSILLLERFLLLILRDLENSECYHPSVISSANKNYSQIDEVCKYLKENLYGRLTLNDLTDKFHFSKSFLCEQFKKNTGASPINYYLDLKLTEAKRLLREDDLTVTEISERLGFDSPEYFSRYFKKRVGHSPRDFKKMLINDASLHKVR